MNITRTGTRCGLAILSILLSPICVIFLIPLMIGLGLDIFDLYGEMPFALALCAPVALLLLRRLLQRAVVRQLTAALMRSAAAA